MEHTWSVESCINLHNVFSLKKISNTGLTNLSLVSTQPSFTKNDYVAVSGYPVVTTDYCYHTLDAYNGGGCLLYAGTFENGEQTNEVMFRLVCFFSFYS